MGRTTNSGDQRRDERGAAAVEFALVVPVLVILMLGIIEMSFLMRDYSSLSSSVRAGARTASAAADAGPGTCEASDPSPPPCTPASVPAFAQAAADTIQQAGTAMPREDIEWLMVYEAGTNGFPLGQTTLTCSSNCVVYVWDAGLGKFRYSSGTWASAGVNACVNDPGRHAVGVGMQADHTWLTGMFGDGLVMQERTVMQFEPLESDRCKPGTANAHA